MLSPLDDDSLIINIPVDNKMGFLRDIISYDNAIKLINEIPSINPIKDINEKNLETKYKEMLNSNNYENLIKIIKTTYLRNEFRINNKKKRNEKDDAFLYLLKNIYITNYLYL